MSVRGLLITSDGDEQAQLVDFAIFQVANHIDNRGMTHRYAVFDEDMPLVLKAVRTINATTQQIVGAGDSESYALLHQGSAPAWQPKPKAARKS